MQQFPLEPKSKLLSSCGAEITLDSVNRVVSRALPGVQAVDFQLLAGGLCNTNLRVRLRGGHQPVVLRLYKRDPANCQKEIDLLRLISPTVPVPRVLYADPDATLELGPCTLLEHVDGVTFQELMESRNLEAIEQASYAIGQTLARIGHYQFPKPGQLGVGLEVLAPYITGAHPIPSLVDKFLASENLQKRTRASLVRRLHDFIWSWAGRLPDLEHECNLVHSDFGSRNIMVRQSEGKWRVAAVLDWEFAFSGSPLLDVGHFLRYENAQQPLREPHFSQGYVDAGGTLPDDWRSLTRVIDLTALVELLTRDELPDEVVSEVLGLVHATID